MTYFLRNGADCIRIPGTFTYFGICLPRPWVHKNILPWKKPCWKSSLNHSDQGSIVWAKKRSLGLAETYSWRVCVLPGTENIGCGEGSLFPWPWFTRFVTSLRDIEQPTSSRRENEVFHLLLAFFSQKTKCLEQSEIAPWNFAKQLWGWKVVCKIWNLPSSSPVQNIFTESILAHQLLLSAQNNERFNWSLRHQPDKKNQADRTDISLSM